MEQIIKSLLETDMYKFSMGQAIYHQFSDYKTTWNFKYGFSYDVLDKFIRTGICTDKAVKEKINARYEASKFKTELIKFPHYSPV